MKKASKILALMAVAAIACSFSMPGPADAATVTKSFVFGGAAKLWSWTESGQDKYGNPVGPSTLPSDMADPAKLTLYDAAGNPTATYRNYRSTYGSLNTWKLNTSDNLVAYNLSGTAAGTGVLPSWGETVTVTGLGGVAAAPAYDNVGTNWFAQINGDEVPTWWCEADADGIDKDLNGLFSDTISLTFDDSALNPDGTVTLWIGGFVTDDLAGLEAGTAGYGQIEGNTRILALTDDDGDGFFAEGDDCLDDPSGDPGICATCACGTAECAPCARCTNTAATEFKSDGHDSNCNGQDDCFIATASFGSSLEGKIDALRDFRDNVLMASHGGRVLVDLYYQYSPAVASFLDDHAGARAAVRTALLPVVGAAWLANSQKGAIAGLAVGMLALGFGVRRRERMKGMLLLAAVVSMMSFPMTASAGECADTVTALLEAGISDAEAVQAALEGCQGDTSEVVAAAIKAGADPFTVAYTAKDAGVELSPREATVSAAEEEFVPPTPPTRISSVPPTVMGTGSSWGESHYVASPSL